ncbi:Hypothetical predicted protein [Olea europaea subsp. europaea]|uniref:Myb/SANT-like DNA-binding domain-containing protein n=1 Tax=Olea europaea subsp. europaea TaxID=158383 RepID=A0A8S0SI52_OLEEU|nr:Hypothetical predicted protein [Olea europaea subsp. europaea]
MDREAKNENSSSFLSINDNKEESPRKPQGGIGGGNSDRLKRDEWSEGAVSSLLEAYESKWTLRNRAKLKGQDWEDVAKHVSSRANSSRSLKTQTQCKNKIESMKKRYRSESATADSSTWPLYPRLDHLLRGNAPLPPPLLSSPQTCHGPTLMFLESSQPQELPQPPLAAPPPQPTLPPAPTTVLQPENLVQNSHGSNGLDRLAKEDGVANKLSDHESDKNLMEIDSSTPLSCRRKDKLKSKNLKTKMGRKLKRRGEESNIAESIRWLAEVVLRSEQARMETMRELERIRAEADAKRGEIDLKRTEIIANTQLEIAKIFAGIGRS